MTTIKINNKITEQERNEISFERHPEFKMIDENTGMIGKYAIIEFDYDIEDDYEVKLSQECVSDLCERHTNIEIMQALALMASKGKNSLYKLQKYINEFNNMSEYDRPIDFFPLVTNESKLQRELCLGWFGNMKEANEYIESLPNVEYSPIGALVHNF